MKVSEAIDQLEAGDMVWVKGKVMDKDDTEFPIQIGGRGYALNTRINRDVEISLTEPQAEKVEVPGFIDKLIRKYKARNETLFCSIADLYNDSDEYKWYVDNVEIYERAWVNGYTVKPKRWVVKFKQQNEQFYFIGWMNSYSTLPAGYGDKEADNVIKFTDKSKAEAVAVLVEGSVEEV